MTNSKGFLYSAEVRKYNNCLIHLKDFQRCIYLVIGHNDYYICACVYAYIHINIPHAYIYSKRVGNLKKYAYN